MVGALGVASRLRPTAKLLVGSCMAFGVVMLASSVAPTLLSEDVLIVLLGVTSITFMATANTTCQLTSVPEMRGRVMALYGLVFLGSTPIGGPIVGWISQSSGPVTAWPSVASPPWRPPAPWGRCCCGAASVPARARWSWRSIPPPSPQPHRLGFPQVVWRRGGRLHLAAVHLPSHAGFRGDPRTGWGGPNRPVAPTRFVVQEHHATALHWDLRLERDGVLVSWALPKGVPPDPRVNHLAVHTEDHPMQYLDFQGSIPAGNYGAGTMSVWDTGTYEPEKWGEREVIVVLHGERVDGRYVLFQTRGKQWMIHRMDPPADPGREVWPGWSEFPAMVAEPGAAVPAGGLRGRVRVGRPAGPHLRVGGSGAAASRRWAVGF